MPPAKWRDWYPHKIDKWRGSLAVQGMSDGAYRGYHNLLMSQWQSSDGMLPTADKELARLSGLFSRWTEFRDEIMENFTRSGDRLINSVQYSEWQRARQISEKKGRKAPECDESVEINNQSESAEWTHAGVNVNVSVPVEELLPLGEIIDKGESPINRKVLSAQCEEIYQAYPRHTAKDVALKSIEKSLKKKPFEELMPIVQAYAAQTAKRISDGKLEKEFIPHPSTWFNQGRYNDDDLKPSPQYDIVEVSPQEFWKDTGIHVS
jgi:hypothetical protein